MEIKNKKKGIKKLLAITLVSVMALGMTSGVAFAKESDEGIEREFTIDVNAPTSEKVKDKDNDFTVDVNKPKNPADVGNGYVVDVNKPNKGKTNNKIPEYDPYAPTKPSNARGTVTESVGSDNKPYPVRDEIKDSVSNKDTGTGQMKERPKADSREFLTFETANGKVFHLIIDRDQEDSNVQLLTEVSEQDLLNMIAADEEANGMGKVQEKPEKEVVKKEEPKKEEPKKEENSKGSFLILIIIAAVVGGAGYYFKVVKPKADDFDDFEDDEIPDDDFFSESEEVEETTEDISEDEEYTEEDLI